MGIFDNYKNLNPDYIPNNSSPAINSDWTTCDINPPYELKDYNGRFIGYTWNFYDTLELVLTIDKKITIPSNAIIYENKDDSPNAHTAGEVGQKAYNLITCKSYTLLSIIEGIYLWEEDEELQYDLNGTKEVILTPDMTNKYLQVEVYDFRGESLHTCLQGNKNTISCAIGKDVKFSPGVYTCKLLVMDEVQNKEVIDKFILSVK